MDVSQLLEESRALLGGSKKQVKFSPRKNVLFEIMTASEHRIFPAVHLWEPEKELFDLVLQEWEPSITSESYYVAVHGHMPDVLCGGNLKWSQLCHMAYFKPRGYEREAFDTKWKRLYNAGSEVNNPSPENRNRDSPNDSIGEGGMGFGGVEFTF